MTLPVFTPRENIAICRACPSRDIRKIDGRNTAACKHTGQAVATHATTGSCPENRFKLLRDARYWTTNVRRGDAAWSEVRYQGQVTDADTSRWPAPDEWFIDYVAAGEVTEALFVQLAFEPHSAPTPPKPPPLPAGDD